MAREDSTNTRQIRPSRMGVIDELAEQTDELGSLEQLAGDPETDGGMAPDDRELSANDEDETRVQAKRSKPLSYLPVERKFGRYELLMDLEAGGMATLYLARLRGPEQFEKLVAIKIIHPHLTRDQNFVKMFHDEARISALLDHPNVVQIYDLGSIDDSYYIAMEYVRGKDYHDVLWEAKRHEQVGTVPLPIEHFLYAARVAADAAAGLHAAHELCSAWGEPLGLVHRDVSPHNILLSFDGHVKLTDFGIAYAKNRITSTASGVLKGKTAYMSPEQAAGAPIDCRTDIFALGVVLWESVTRKRLFRRESDTATLHALTHEPIPCPRDAREDVPEILDRIVMKALARDPEDRYQTAEAFQRALEKYISNVGGVVGATELKVMMDVLFSAHKTRLDEQIHNRLEQTDALHTTDQTLPSGSIQRGTRETRLSAQAHRSPTAERGNRILGRNALLMGLLLVLGLGGYLLLRDPGPDTSHRGATTAPPRPPPRATPQVDAAVVRRPPSRHRPQARPKKLVVTFVVKPDRARPTILFRGKRYPQRRVDLLLGVGEQTEQVRVEAPGYHAQTLYVTVRPEAKLRHEIMLRPLRRRPMVRRPPRPVMRPSDPPRPVDIGLD